MAQPGVGFALRLAPVALAAAAAGVWFYTVQAGGPWVLRNCVPLVVLVLLAALTLRQGGGRWTGAGLRMPLGTLGFAIPALCLALYLHYAYAVNLDGMFDGAARPAELFRYLPVYTTVAGGIGFAIGYIVGRNI